MNFYEDPDKRCVLCGFEKPGTRVFERDAYFFTCPLCGVFEVDEYALVTVLPRLTDRDLARLRGVVRERYETLGPRNRVYISEATISDLISEAPDSFDAAAKVRKLLCSLARRSKFPGDRVMLSQDDDRAIAYAENVGAYSFRTTLAIGAGLSDGLAIAMKL